MATTLDDQAVIREALEVLFRHLEPAKAARFLSTWKGDGGDYMAIRDRLFAGKTVDDLVREMREFQEARRS